MFTLRKVNSQIGPKIYRMATCILHKVCTNQIKYNIYLLNMSDAYKVITTTGVITFHILGRHYNKAIILG